MGGNNTMILFLIFYSIAITIIVVALFSICSIQNNQLNHYIKHSNELKDKVCQLNYEIFFLLRWGKIK
jgi:hypothetical protein